MTQILIVNASHVLTDDEASAVVPSVQKWDDTIVRPAWGFDACTYGFSTWANFRANPPGNDVWPIFLNRHSADPGVGGFHDDVDDRVFGRIFVGDALRYGVSWTVDLTHEAAEMRGNPYLTETVTLSTGQVALRELGDPVEDDALGIDIDGVKCTDIVLPSYFSGGAGPWDYGGHLTGPCPTLCVGGYQSLFENGNWTQVTAMYLGGRPSWRSVRFHNSLRRLKLDGVSTP